MNNNSLCKIMLVSLLFTVPILCSCGKKGATTPTATPPSTTTTPDPYSITWQSLGSAITGPASSISLKVYNGVPYLAYIGPDNLAHVKKYETSNAGWTEVLGTSATSSATLFVRLEIDTLNGNLFIVYVEKTANNVKVKKFSSGVWTNIGAILGTSTSAPAIAIYQSNPVIAFIDSSTLKATANFYDGSSWLPSAVVISNGAADNVSLAIDPALTKGYIAYSDGTVANKISVRVYDIGIGLNPPDLGFSSGAASYITIAIDSNGIPFVSYVDANLHKAISMKYVPSAWVPVGTSISDGDAAALSMYIYGTHPAVCYSDAAHDDKLTYKFSDGTVWSSTTISGFSENAITETAIFVAPAGADAETYIAYIDKTTSGIIIKKF